MTQINDRSARARPFDKALIAGDFGRAADYYDVHAEAQRRAAGHLVGGLRPYLANLPEGPVLEIGCGTGFVTRYLVQGLALEGLARRTLEITDLSEEMLAYSRRHLAWSGSGRVRFYVADGERWDSGERRYALVVAGCVAQWFTDPAAGLVRLARGLAEGGILSVSFPVMGTFPEWREASERASLPFTAAGLSDADDILAGLRAAGLDVLSSSTEGFTEFHSSPQDFLRHLKRIGAATPVSGAPPLSLVELRRLFRAWTIGSGGQIAATYRILFLTARATAA